MEQRSSKVFTRQARQTRHYTSAQSRYDRLEDKPKLGGVYWVLIICVTIDWTIRPWSLS